LLAALELVEGERELQDVAVMLRSILVTIDAELRRIPERN